MKNKWTLMRRFAVMSLVCGLASAVGWVLDGRAIQDIFTIFPSEAGKDRYIATNLRYFDAKTGTWHATFVESTTSCSF